MLASFHLFIATTLDGYIARENGAIDWLEEFPHPEGEDYGYHDFIAGIDTIVMGRSTYETVTGFDVPWPYPGLRCIVITSDADYSVSTPDTEVQVTLDKKTIQALREQSQKGIWIVGGGQLIAGFLEYQAIDRMVISLLPLTIGRGIPLFPPHAGQNPFTLIQSESFSNGIVNLTYQRS